MAPKRIDVEVSATCLCPKCRILRALAEGETQFADAVEALGRVIAILSIDLAPEQQSAVRSVFESAWLAETRALAGEAPLTAH